MKSPVSSGYVRGGGNTGRWQEQVKIAEQIIAEMQAQLTADGHEVRGDAVIINQEAVPQNPTTIDPTGGS